MPFLIEFVEKLPIIVVELEVLKGTVAVDWRLSSIIGTGSEFCFSGVFKCTKVFSFCQLFNNKALTIYLSAKAVLGNSVVIKYETAKNHLEKDIIVAQYYFGGWTAK